MVETDENNESRLQKVVDLYKEYLSENGLKQFQLVFRKSFDSDPNKRYFRYTDKELIEDAWQELGFTNKLYFFNNAEDVIREMESGTVVPFLIISEIDLGLPVNNNELLGSQKLRYFFL